MISGGKAVARALLAAGVDHAFCVPGESFLGLLDALYDTPQIRVIATRHEGGAAFMAEAFGKLTRRPAVCMGTRMVGACNLATGTEVETAVREGVPIVVLVYDNAQYGTIRMHQELEHPGRQIATALGPVDFAAMARALGADGVTVRDEHEFSPLLRDALRSQKPTVFHLRVDPEQISVASDVA
jgi:thiamine pyrophosphate-dependent acetolactate synthase large subunit-like protein